MELVKFENNALSVAEETLQKISALNEAKIELDFLMDRVKKELLEVMRDNGIKKFENEYFSATYVAPTTQKRVDTNALKEQGLYESFLKEIEVKETLKVSFK